MTKISKPVLYMAIAALGVIVYLMTTPPSTPKKGLKKTVVSHQQSVKDTYTVEDRTAHFGDKILVSRDALGTIRKTPL